MPLRRHGFIACSARQSLKPWATVLWATVQITAATDLSLGVLRALRAHIARAYGAMQSTRSPCNRFFRNGSNRAPAPIEGALLEEGGGQGVAVVSGLTGGKWPEKTLHDPTHENRVSIVGELASSVAREITEPIASARNNARAALNFLDKDPPDLGEVREALGCVVDDADRAGVILDRIRDHIKKAPPRKHRTDLNEAINEVIVLARSANTSNGVSAHTHLSEGLAPVEGDRVHLQQVILNLIRNSAEAVSAIDGGSRELLISTVFQFTLPSAEGGL